MKVKCIANTGEGLSEKGIQVGYTKDHKFAVEIGQEYIVYAMSMGDGFLDYLLLPNAAKNPSWFPAEIFEVVDHLLPIIWCFSCKNYTNYKGQESQVALWGYQELIANPDHYIDLCEYEEKALEIFFRRKEQIDEYQEITKCAPQK